MVFSKLFSRNKSKIKYNERIENTFCMRKHCTDECIQHDDKFKPWADFLVNRTVNRSLLYSYIRQMPDVYRIAVYLKCIGPRKIEDQKIEIVFEDKNSESSQNLCEKIYIKDTLAIERIMNLSKGYLIGREEEIFNIFKHCFLMYGTNDNFITLIINLLLLPNATFDSVFKILTQLIEKYKLLECIDDIIIDEISDENEPIDIERLITAPDDRLIHDTIEDIFLKDFQLFLWLTDVCFAVNKPYIEVVRSLYKKTNPENQDELLKILKAKSNLRFIDINYEEIIPEVIYRKKENYFDFLIIQSNLIKAQESMKNEYEKKISELEQQIEDSKMIEKTMSNI